jgi:hypothetical protein
METWGMTADEVVLARIVYSNRDELQRIHKGKTNKLNRLSLSNRKLLREIGIIRTRRPERAIINIELLNYYLALPCNQFIHRVRKGMISLSKRVDKPAELSLI